MNRLFTFLCNKYYYKFQKYSIRCGIELSLRIIRITLKFRSVFKSHYQKKDIFFSDIK